MEKWLELFGAGHFTSGAKYICFLPRGSKDYVNIAQAPTGTEDDPEWTMFADALVEQLNRMHSR